MSDFIRQPAGSVNVSGTDAPDRLTTDRNVPACSGCHGPTGAGNPSQYPRLSGQHADYAEAQLKAFRDGPRKNSPQMTGVVSKMNDREIKAVSDYMAGMR